MVEKPSVNLKHAHKYALARIKQLRDQRVQSAQQLQQQHNETGTALTSRPKPTSQITGAIRKQTKALRAEQLTRIVVRKQPTEQQHQRQLLTHKYTDVSRIGIIDEKMAEGSNNETKPLTQQQYAHITQKPKVQPKYSVHRNVLTHEVVIKQTGYAARDKSIPSALRTCWQNWSFLPLFTGVIPILEWLPKYSLKRDLLGDIIAGFTVAIMHIPHGMAYGLLAGVSPSSGLYMAVFPVLVYMVLGTSRHISIGTFAVASMMSLKVVQTYATDESVLEAATAATAATNTTTNNSTNSVDIVTPIQVITSLSLAVGIVHLVMAFFHLGTLSSLLSEPLINGFTTGAACQVIASQLKDVLGVTVPRYKGAFKIIYTLIDVAKAVPDTNIAALIFCLCIIAFMIFSNEFLKPCLSKRCRFPLPAELMAVIGGTIVSKLLSVHNNYGVALVGVIPKGLPTPEFPRLDLVPKVAPDSITIAFVTYSIVMSMGLTFAKKHSYEVRPNQELFAMGIGNVVGSCFSCIPLACSLSRSVIQDQTGGATQIASLVSAVLIVITLLWAGPFFSDLARCVLAGVIVVALKPMFMQAKELKKFAKQGKLEMFTWIATFVSVVVIDIDIGLLIGVGVSLLALYIKGFKPYSALLGYVPEGQAIYVDLNQHRNAFEVPETKIFRYCGSLNFATNLFFRRALYEAIGTNNKRSYTSAVQQNGSGPLNNETTQLNSFRFLILDFSMLGHIDVAGCRTLSDVNKEMNARGVRLFLTSPIDRVYDTLVHSMALGEGPFEVFPTLHDTVEYANACRTT